MNTSDSLRQRAGDSNWIVRRTVAENAETPADVLATLAGDADKDVRRAVARNPNAPPEVLQRLTHDADAEVRRLAGGRNAPPSEQPARKAAPLRQPLPPAGPNVPPPPAASPPPAAALPPEPGAKPVSTLYTVTLVLSACFLGIQLLGEYLGEKIFALDFSASLGIDALLVVSLMLGNLIAYAILHFRCWQALPARFRDGVSPGAALGFLFIPLFNFYWGFVTWPGLVRGYAKWQRACGETPTANGAVLALIYAALWIAVCGLEIVMLLADSQSGVETFLGYLELLCGVANLVLFVLIYQPLTRFVERRMTGIPSLF
jgi:hypothetical protein